jgi:serine/threonine-protein kinase mTOR
MKAPPNVVYAQLKYMWAAGAREESLTFLRQFSASLARDLQAESSEHAQRTGVSKQKLAELSRLLARCYFKQGEWQMELKEDWGSVRPTLACRFFEPDIRLTEKRGGHLIVSLPCNTL